MKCNPTIRVRISAAFGILITALVVVSGLYHYFSIKRVIDREEGRRLIAIGKSAAFYVPLQLVLHFKQGDDTSGSYSVIQNKLQLIQETLDIHRIYIVNMKRELLSDSDQGSKIGTAMSILALFEGELKRSERGEPSYSRVFTGDDGNYYKSGFVPIMEADACQGFICVEAGSEFPHVMNALGKRIVAITVATVLLTALLGILLAYHLTIPLKQLSLIARRFGDGQLEQSVPRIKRGEVADLAFALEYMRKGLLARDEQLKSMLAQVAHEIRNPLGGIELLAGMLREDVSENTQSLGYVDRILKETRTLNSIITEYLLFAGAIKLNPTWCDLGELLDEIKELVHDKLATTGISLRIITTPNNQFPLWVDPRHFRQALLNLVLNAIQACSQGNEIVIEASQTLHSLIIAVADTGRGIAPEFRQSIFEPFKSSKQEGWGLGLTVVKRIIEAHQGTIQLVDRPEFSTVFQITLPLQQEKGGNSD